ncbi:hypothetical protein ACIQYZ_13445 [Rhodococcus erythropolis]
MTPKITAEQATKAASAYESILAAGGRASVRALAREAGIATEAARTWLNTARPAPVNTPAPDEVATAVTAAIVDRVWPAALTAAREEIADEAAQEVEALRAAEAEAAQEVESLRAELTKASARIEELTAELGKSAAAAEAAQVRASDAESAAEQARAQAEASVQDAAAAHAAEIKELTGRVTAAEQAAAVAKAQADTLMAVVEAIRPRAEAEAKTLHETLSTLNESR